MFSEAVKSRLATGNGVTILNICLGTIYYCVSLSRGEGNISGGLPLPLKNFYSVKHNMLVHYYI